MFFWGTLPAWEAARVWRVYLFDTLMTEQHSYNMHHSNISLTTLRLSHYSLFLPFCLPLRGFWWLHHPRIPCAPAHWRAEAEVYRPHLPECSAGKEESVRSAYTSPFSSIWISKKTRTVSQRCTVTLYSSALIEKSYVPSDLCLSLLKHVRVGLLQVFLLCLGRVINIDWIGRAVWQVGVIDGASCCLQLRAQ